MQRLISKSHGFIYQNAVKECQWYVGCLSAALRIVKTVNNGLEIKELELKAEKEEIKYNRVLQ